MITTTFNAISIHGHEKLVCYRGDSAYRLPRIALDLQPYRGCSRPRIFKATDDELNDLYQRRCLGVYDFVQLEEDPKYIISADQFFLDEHGRIRLAADSRPCHGRLTLDARNMDEFTDAVNEDFFTSLFFQNPWKETLVHLQNNCIVLQRTFPGVTWPRHATCVYVSYYMPDAHSIRVISANIVRNLEFHFDEWAAPKRITVYHGNANMCVQYDTRDLCSDITNVSQHYATMRIFYQLRVVEHVLALASLCNNVYVLMWIISLVPDIPPVRDLSLMRVIDKALQSIARILAGRISK